MAHNLVVTAQKPTGVTHAITGNFTSPDDINLILVKTTRIEIHVLGSEGLKPLLDVGLYGRISTIFLFRPPKQKKDLLFVSTERNEVCVLSYNSSTGEIVTEASGNVSERVGRKIDGSPISMVDPECKVIFMLLYTGSLKCIPLDETGQLKEAFNIRQEELSIIDMTYLHGPSKPTLAVLYQDTKDARHVKTYHLMLREKEFQEGPWALPNVEGGASRLIAVPQPLGGLIIVCEQTITYFNGPGTQRSIATPTTCIVSHGRIDPDGSRFLLGDDQGLLYILFLKKRNSALLELKLERVGETSAPKALCYLDNSYFFVGSYFGDSQLIRLRTESDEHGSFVEVLETFNNLGPIVDFCVVDLDRQGQGQLVTCSGVGKDGSLRVVRNGVGINELAMLELQGISGIWALRKTQQAKFDSTLVVSFVGETRVLSISGEELEETEIPGMSTEEQTLHCADVINDQIIQITGSSIRLIDGKTDALNGAYKPPSGRRINVAASNPSQILASIGSGTLVLLEVVGNQLLPKKEVTFEHEIACLAINPLGAETHVASLAAVGFWTDVSVRILRVPELETLWKQGLGGDVIPRSVLLGTFEGIDYCLCGMGDGQLVSHVVETGGRLGEQKRVNLGTQPVQLTSFRSQQHQLGGGGGGGSAHVFASSDRPTVIYSSNRKLLFSNVNVKEAASMTPLHSELFMHCLAFSSRAGLTIGTIDEIQKLHIRSIPLHESPRRITHVAKPGVFAVLTSSLTVAREEVAHVRIIDEQTFEILDSFKFEPNEMPCSLATVTFNDDVIPSLVVGTAHVVGSEDEPSKGRIVVLQVTEAKGLRMVTSKEVRGAVYALEGFHGKVLAGINSKVQLYKLTQSDDAAHELVSECGHHGHVVALYLRAKGDFILVGDMIKSFSLLLYKPIDGSLEEIARDYNTNMLTAIEILDDDVYLGAEDHCNLFVAKKNSEGATDEERRKLEVVGQFHVGLFINRFRKGSLVMKLPENEFAHVDTFLFCTTSGAIGVLASLPAAKYQQLRKVEGNLTKIIRGVGDLSHEKWRAFTNERKEVESRNFLDGDLLESFLDLPREKMKEVVSGANGGVPLDLSLDDLTKLIEELTRLH